MESICQALNLSDNAKCVAKVSETHDVFCPFHARQAKGLYLGYKKRTAKLNSLTLSEPEFLAESGVSLSTQTFADLDNEKDLLVVCNHLHKRHRLLSDVAQARRWHHDHFFPLKLDYGHEKFIEKLNFEKLTVLRALERAERRMAEVSYSKQRWFKWSRKVQEEDDLSQEKEKKKVAMENAMFQRQVKQMQSRMKSLRAKEDKKRQEAFLEQAYQERLREEDEMQWDPIDEEMYSFRDDYIDLIRHFLWMPVEMENIYLDPPKENGADHMEGVEIENGDVEKPKTKKKKKKKKANPPANTRNGEDNTEGGNERVPDKTRIEQEDEMRKRLESGAKFNYEGSGPMMVGTFENPRFVKKTPGLENDMIDQLIKDVTEIKQLLFCRALLSQAALVPEALKANSVEEFLANTEVSDTALRDLCLRLEQPGLQAIRDACADLHRPEIEEDLVEESEEVVTTKKSRRLPHLWDRDNTKTWKPNRDRTPNMGNPGEKEGGEMVDFGSIEEADPGARKGMPKVKLCGKTIWNHASQTSMSRSGWLQFSIIAKDESLLSAVRLCRSWDEFFELNALALVHYFPAANWQSWVKDLMNNQLLKMGIFTYFSNTEAERFTVTRNTNQRHAPRTHHVQETRSILCCHMKRNDPAVRRFIQYVVMYSSQMHILVRDAKTGNFITEPTNDDLWLIRMKRGIGRAAKNTWDVIRSVDEQFFEEMDQIREWHFSFDDYYDVYVWDNEAGQPFAWLYENIQMLWYKARRISGPQDIYQPVESIYRTLTRDKKSRPRDIKLGEEVESLWDEILKIKLIFGIINPQTGEGFSEGFSEEAIANSSGKEIPKGFRYTAVDALEDEILFPEITKDDSAMSLNVWEKRGPSMARFALNLDSDEESIHSLDEVKELNAKAKDLTMEDSIDDDENSEWEDDDHDDSEMSEGEVGEYHPPTTPQDVWSWEGRFENERKAWNTGYLKIVSCLLFYVMFPESCPEFLLQDATFQWFKQWEKDSPPINRKPRLPSEPTKEEFLEYILRDKSHVFKKAFHDGDLEPGYAAKHEESTKFLLAIEKNAMVDLHRAKYYTSIIDFLNIHPRTHKWILRDMAKAYMAMCPFFEGLEAFSLTEFYEEDHGRPYKSSDLLDVELRAQTIPNRRSCHSNTTRPAEHWAEWNVLHDQILAHVRGERVDSPGLPEEWELLIRPAIAKLYKAGMIKPCSDEAVSGQVVALREPGRDLDIYFDYEARKKTRYMATPAPLEEPSRWPDLLPLAQSYAANNEGARFALLRVFSGPHFWPLMSSMERRHETSFHEPWTKRNWEWKFSPKDYIFGESSMHYNISNAVNVYAAKFKKQVVPRRDIVFVMAKDVEELAKLCTAATYAIQDKPFIREVDLWKSFIDVDIGFLERLDKYWLD